MRVFKGYLIGRTGSTVGSVSGNQVFYKRGQFRTDLPEGELDHVGHVEAVYDDEEPEVRTADVTSGETKTRPVKPTRKRRPSTAKKGNK